MKSRKNQISLYCKCEICNKYFEVTGRKRSKYCSRNCRDKAFHINKKIKLSIN